ncbi:HD domain-containing protein [Streptomyces sp. HPF1205]|uniref:HD domain-containing protein n=1 Tax=Streptomyces sp. HPF1205 TaxID=2873262 RepID=UPI001CED7CEC|nr:HD domain-containing protein [Streptomyces sp. HPF1205]
MSTTPPTESLVELAARKQLPRHQYTDHATVRWIEANRPDFPRHSTAGLSRASQRLLQRSATPTDWWAEAQVTDSLHGVRHAMRTAALSALLAEDAGLRDEETADLVLAAALHDCRRLHDRDDRGHGNRAALWLTRNADAVWGHFGLTATPLRIDRAATAVRLHDVPYPDFSPDDEADYARTGWVCDLLKAADALDRYRQPKLGWWPDAHQVRSDAFDRFRATAFDLVVRSETAHLAGLGSAGAVFEALRQGELIS